MPNPNNSTRDADPKSASRARLWFNRSLALRLIGAGALIFAGWWVINWANTDAPDAPVTSGDQPTIRIENLRSFVVREGGKRLWQLAAREIIVAPDKSYTEARNVSRGTFFRDDREFLHLSAQKVRLWNQTNNLEASGGVKVSGPDQFSFQTPKANWDAAQKRVSCPENVKASLRGLDFSAPALLYEWEKGDLICPKTAQIVGNGFVLRAPNARASTKTRIVTLGGGAELIFDPKTVKLPAKS